MSIFVYDLEVFAYDWVFVARDPESDYHTVIHNDTNRLRAYIDNCGSLASGFNIKHYDNSILKVIYYGGSNEDVKRCNDWIIKERKNGWEFPFLQYKRNIIKSFDLRSDLPKDLSLKAIEGNMCLPIVESSVPFDIDRPLTPEELVEVIEYCKTDVDSTIELYKVRKPDYLDAKAMVGEMYGVPVEEALGYTNASLSARVLGAKKTIRNDERDYVIPDNIDVNLIPKIVLDFFMQIRDKSIPDTKLFGAGKGTKGLNLKLWFRTARGSCPVTYAWGGVHGAKPRVIVEETADRVIVNQDVASLYPNSMINFGYCSRSMADPKAYEKLVKRRLEYKKAGQKKEANALKLVVNTVYGAMLNNENDLVDRLAGRSVCISNQLAITMLIVQLAQSCESIDFVNINTDGIMFTIDRNEVNLSQKIIDEWSEVTKFEMERDDFVKVIQKDVNNYIGITPDGKFKTKGGFVSNYNGGNFKSNSMTILDKAVVDYLVSGTPVEQTINECTDIFKFQRIEKTGDTYNGSYQYVNGERVPIQNVNRIYAVKNPIYGQIVKGKWITEKREKDKATGKMISKPVNPPKWSETTIPDCPDHAFIDNENVLTVDDIDKGYYIDMAKKRVDMYIKLDKDIERELNKIKEEVVIMATKKEETKTEPLNVYAKLAVARQKFLEAPVKKSGINRFAEYKYFELEDIVPVATSIFNELGLVFFIQFTKEDAIGTLVNTDNPEEKIIFNSPMIELTVLDKEGNIKPPAGMNSVQALGSTQTYQRRYLYMACLDIVEADAFDATNGKADPETGKAETAPKKSNRPKTTEEREEIKEGLTNTEAQATDAEIKAIKNGLKKLRAKDEKYEDFITSCAKLIKTGLTKKEAEDLLIDIGEKIEE